MRPYSPTDPPGLGNRLFNLVFSLLPAKIRYVSLPIDGCRLSFLCRGVVGFLGFTSDRKLALQSLAVSANYTDVHGVFAGCVPVSDPYLAPLASRVRRLGCLMQGTGCADENCLGSASAVPASDLVGCPS